MSRCHCGHDEVYHGVFFSETGECCARKGPYRCGCALLVDEGLELRPEVEERLRRPVGPLVSMEQMRERVNTPAPTAQKGAPAPGL